MCSAAHTLSVSEDHGALVFWLALATAVATFPLIFMGGLVTTYHAGMSVPDWPNSYGYNMFLFPPNRWVGGILYEHTHRLMGTLVGLLAMGLVLAAWIRRDRHRYLALWVLAAVILQGVLGGLRVVLVKLDLAIIHGCVAQAFFCLAAYMALVSSSTWRRAPDLSRRPGGAALIRLGVVTTVIIFAQLIVGAAMRHYDAGLAIPDLPLAYGKLLPPTNPEQLEAVNRLREFKFDLAAVTMTQVWLHFGHRIGALLVTIVVLTFAHNAFWRNDAKGLAGGALLLVTLLMAQLTLGVITVLKRKPADITSIHVAVGALVLVTSFVLTAKIIRLYGGRRGEAAFAPASGLAAGSL